MGRASAAELQWWYFDDVTFDRSGAALHNPITSEPNTYVYGEL